MANALNTTQLGRQSAGFGVVERGDDDDDVEHKEDDDDDAEDYDAGGEDLVIHR